MLNDFEFEFTVTTQYIFCSVEYGTMVQTVGSSLVTQGSLKDKRQAASVLAILLKQILLVQSRGIHLSLTYHHCISMIDKGRRLKNIEKCRPIRVGIYQIPNHIGLRFTMA